MLKTLFNKVRKDFEKAQLGGGCRLTEINNNNHLLRKNRFASPKILRETAKYKTYSLKYQNINLFISNPSRPNRKLADLLLKRVLVMRRLMRGNDFGEELNIYLWLTDKKKTLPRRTGQILGIDEINSGSTDVFPDRNGNIFIWRKEELEKVLIHELLHSFHADYHLFDILDSKTKKHFNINNNINTHEAYTEFLTTVLNCTFHTLENEGGYRDFLVGLEKERRFSLGQVYKILDYYGFRGLGELERGNSRNGRKIFRQNTSVFSYYILKTALLFNSENILVYMKRNNKDLFSISKNRGDLFFDVVVKSFDHLKKAKRCKNRNKDSLKMVYL